jgi:hypothetical protein
LGEGCFAYSGLEIDDPVILFHFNPRKLSAFGSLGKARHSTIGR